jgi:hypothetical protein
MPDAKDDAADPGSTGDSTEAGPRSGS